MFGSAISPRKRSSIVFLTSRTGRSVVLTTTVPLAISAVRPSTWFSRSAMSVAIRSMIPRAIASSAE